MAVDDNYREVIRKSGKEVTHNLLTKLAQYATGSLPTASSFEGCIVYDTTTNEVKYSNGSTWTAL